MSSKLQTLCFLFFVAVQHIYTHRFLVHIYIYIILYLYIKERNNQKE